MAKNYLGESLSLQEQLQRELNTVKEDRPDYSMADLSSRRGKLSRDMKRAQAMQGRQGGVRMGSPMMALADSLSGIVGTLKENTTERGLSELAVKEARLRKIFMENPDMIRGLMSTDPGMQRVGQSMHSSNIESQKISAQQAAAALAQKQRVQAANVSNQQRVDAATRAHQRGQADDTIAFGRESQLTREAAARQQAAASLAQKQRLDAATLAHKRALAKDQVLTGSTKATQMVAAEKRLSPTENLWDKYSTLQRELGRYAKDNEWQDIPIPGVGGVQNLSERGPGSSVLPMAAGAAGGYLLSGGGTTEGADQTSEDEWEVRGRLNRGGKMAVGGLTTALLASQATPDRIGFLARAAEGGDQGVFTALKDFQNAIVRQASGADVTDSEVSRLAQAMGTDGLSSTAAFLKTLPRYEAAIIKDKDRVIDSVHPQVKQAWFENKAYRAKSTYTKDYNPYDWRPVASEFKQLTDKQGEYLKKTDRKQVESRVNELPLFRRPGTKGLVEDAEKERIEKARAANPQARNRKPSRAQLSSEMSIRELLEKQFA